MAWNGYMLPPQTESKVMAPVRRFVGRRKLCFDGISSMCSSSDTHHDDDSVSPRHRIFTKTYFFSIYLLLNYLHCYFEIRMLLYIDRLFFGIDIKYDCVID